MARPSRSLRIDSKCHAIRAASDAPPTHKENIMNLIIWLIVGALIGAVAGHLMRESGGIIMNAVVGIAGSALGGWLLSPYFGGGTINQGDFSVTSLVVSLLGAVILLAIVNLFRRRRVR